MIQFECRTLIAALCFLPLMSATAAPAAEAPDPVAQLRAFLTSTQSARGQFYQTVSDKYGNEVMKPSSGVFRFMRPGRFEWTYEKPYEQKIMSDGQTLWIHDPELFQVTVKKLEGTLPATPAAMLFGDANWEEGWTLSEKSGLVEARPKTTEGGFEQVRIVFDRKGELEGMAFLDSFGQTTLLHFSGIVREPMTPESFTLQIPEGTDVVESAL